MFLNRVQRVYASVNVAGFVNDKWVSPRVLHDGIIRLPSRALPAGRQAFGARVVGACDAVLRRGMREGQQHLASGLMSRRSPPFLPSPILMASSCATGLPLAAYLYPVADFLLGRGHDPAFADHPEIQPTCERNTFDAYNAWSHHGIAGYLLEAAPVRAAQHFEQQGQVKLASACMLAAVAGRMVLQVPRLLVSAFAVLAELCWVVPLEVLLAVCELSARTLLGAVRLFAAFSGLDISRFERGYDIRPLADDDLDMDDGSPGVHQRVRERVNRLILRLRPLYQDDNAKAEDIMRVVHAAAQDLRSYCFCLPDETALRGGLSLLRANVEQLWPDDKDVVFDPPELAACDADAPRKAA